MLHQKTRIPKYTDNINPNKNKPRPNMDAIINEQRAEELRKETLAKQCEHNLDDIPAEILLESYMLSQIEEQKDNTKNNNNTNSNGNSDNDKAQEERDRLLAMQLEFALEDEHGLANIDNRATTTTTTDTNSSNKKTWKGNTNRYKNETKIRIQPNYYFDDTDNTNNTGERANEEEEYGHEEEEDTHNNPRNNNNNNSKVRSEPYGNKTTLSGTANRHRFEEWSEKHVNRLHEYNVNLGGESEFKNVRLGNKAYNSFRRDLEKKGFKKFDQPTPAEKK